MLAHRIKRAKNPSIDSSPFGGITFCESLKIGVFCSADRHSSSDRSINRFRDENDDPFAAYGFSPPPMVGCADSLKMLENQSARH